MLLKDFAVAEGTDNLGWMKAFESELCLDYQSLAARALYRFKQKSVMFQGEIQVLVNT